MIWLCVGVPAVGVLALTVVIPCAIRVYQEVSGQTAEPHLPDLSGCTHLEIRHETPLEAPPFNDSGSGFLTAEEAEYLASLKRLTVIENPEYISDLAHEVALAKYQRWPPEHERIHDYFRITAYCASARTVSFIMFADRLETEDGHVFTNPGFPLCLERIRPQIAPFLSRLICMKKMGSLQRRFHNLAGKENEREQVSQWCDVIKQAMQAGNLPENDVKWAFSCPNIRDAACHYAMNADCLADSPPDTVCLFETTAGWNQHGGPELFTFDNHDPKGGLVLLNDGTVKFIRTEEELKQLRWK